MTLKIIENNRTQTVDTGTNRVHRRFMAATDITLTAAQRKTLRGEARPSSVPAFATPSARGLIEAGLMFVCPIRGRLYRTPAGQAVMEAL